MFRNEKYHRSNVETVVPSHLNFGKYLLKQFLLHQDKTALINGNKNERMSYRELLYYAVKVALSLVELGAGVGDVVAVCCEIRNEFIPTVLGVVLSGAAYTPHDVTIGKVSLKHKLELVKPKYVIVSIKFWNQYNDVFKNLNFVQQYIMMDDVDTPPMIQMKNLMSKYINIDRFEPANVKGQTDVALILYSSGSTGLPKGVPKSHLSCIINSQIGNFDDPQYKTMVCGGEWSHSYDSHMTFKFLSAGRTVVYFDETCESFLQCVQDYQANIAFTFPSLIHKLSYFEDSENYNVETLKYIYCATSALDNKIREKFLTRFPKVEFFVQSYGMTETFELTSERWATPGLKKNSVGKVAPCVTIKIADINTGELLGPNQKGEIHAHSVSIMNGYIGVDPSTYLDEEGFIKTGDLGYYDEDGYFYIVDRIKEIISYNGFKISPLELEAVLISHPHVEDVGVAGKPVPDFGEEPTAFVVPKPGTGVSEKELLDFVNKQVATYMQMRGGLFFVNEIPRNNIGKIIRPALKVMIKKLNITHTD